MPTYRGADGAELHYDIRGDGPTVIVLGGGAPRHPDYLGDLAGLTDHLRLVIPHHRGVGRSPAAEGDIASWWHQAADVEQLRLHLGLERAVVAGHSSGTRLAIAFAVQHPSSVSRLLLATPPAAYLVDEPSDVPAIAARRTDAEFARAFARLADGYADQEALEQWIADTAPAGYARWGEAEQLHSRVGESDAQVNRAYFAIAPPADLPQRLATVREPVLVIAGSEDALTGVTQAVALAGLFPNGSVTVIDACGHYPWVEQPGAFRDAVLPFLLEE